MIWSLNTWMRTVVLNENLCDTLIQDQPSVYSCIHRAATYFLWLNNSNVVFHRHAPPFPQQLFWRHIPWTSVRHINIRSTSFRNVPWSHRRQYFGHMDEKMSARSSPGDVVRRRLPDVEDRRPVNISPRLCLNYAFIPYKTRFHYFLYF